MNENRERAGVAAGEDTPNLLTVVVPAFNERPTLRASLERLFKTTLPLPFEVVVVDDGSSDGTAESISDLVADGQVRLLTHDKNRGKGAAIRTGIENATGDLLTILDGDLEYDPADYRDLLTPLLAGEASAVYGTRSFGSHTAFSFWYVLGNRFLAFWASLLFNSWLTDIETCFKMAPTSVWRSLRLTSRGFGIEAEVTGKLLRQGNLIFEVPIGYRARRREEGKKLRWTDGLAALWILLRVRVVGR